MARYINAEQMKGDIKIAMANQQSKDPHNLLPTHLAELLCQFVDDTPTADVAPRAEVARDIVEFLFRRSESLQHLFKDNPDSAQCFRGRFELENAAIIIANEYGVDLTKELAEKALERSGE